MQACAPLSPRLALQDLVLRAPQAGDLPAFMAYQTGPRTTYTGGPLAPHKAAEKFSGLAGQWALYGFGRYVIADAATDRPLGHAGPLRHLPEAAPEMTWTLWSGADEGKGIARRAVGAVLAELAKRGWGEIIAWVDGKNTQSLRLAEALGTRDPAARSPEWLPEGVIFRMGGQA